MRNLLFLTLLAITVSVSAKFSSAQELILEGSKFKAKGGARVELSEDPKLAMIATLTDMHLNLEFSDGKKKFGAPVIKVQSGENVFMLPRLKLSVPIKELESVKSGAPLLVSSFSVRDVPFKAHLVHSRGAIPNVVVTTQAKTDATAKDLASEDELYTGKEFARAMTMPTDDPELPNVLLIGDSISIGYTVDVRKRLKGKADVFRIPTNGKYASYGSKNIDKWLGNGKWDVIHFNWGLWDICYRNPKSKTQGHRDKVNGTLTASPEQYRESLEQIVKRLKQTNATLIWCATTPVPEHEAGRKMGDEIKYNAIAASIMQENGILINDLHAHALQGLPEIQNKKGDVHFNSKGYAYLADEVAQAISAGLAIKDK